MASQSAPGTFAALRNQNFRLYFLGQLASTSGTWMQLTAQGWLVFQLTHSAAWLGVVAGAAGLPILALSPVAGVVVERFSRRQTMLVTQTIQMILALLLAGLVFSNTVQIWHIIVLAVLLGITNAVDGTARFAIIADLVEREHLRSAITLNSILFNLSRVLGPAAAGLALTTLGAGWCFLLNGLSFVPVIASLLVITVRPSAAAAANESPLQQLAAGLRYARGHQQILPSLLLAAIAGMLGVSLLTLFPAFAAVVLHSPTTGYTVLNVANGLGGILGGFIIGALSLRLGLGRLIALMALLTAASMGLLAGPATVASAALVAFGFGLVIVMLFVGASTLIQTEVPNDFRGRVLALYTLAFSGLTPFGALALGLVSAKVGVLNAFWLSAGLSGLLSVAVLARWPGLWRQPLAARTVLRPIVLAEKQA
jgi:MFS family permease